MDYIAEILPVVILSQPSVTDVWGNPKSKSMEHFPGIAITPVGLRMLWRDGKRIKPYYLAKGGMIGFTKKAFSQYAAYENFTLQQSLGLQVRLNEHMDLRTGFLYFHISNAFVTPSNPGADLLTVNAGLVYRFGRAE